MAGRPGRGATPWGGMARPGDMASLSTHDLEVWRGDYCVCTNLTIEARPGQLLHLRGGNGAGKTSLIRVLAGLAPPAAGEIGFAGRPVRADMGAFRAAISYVGHSNGIKGELTPMENLRVTASLAFKPSSEAPESALARVGLAAHAHRLSAELSAGQRRRTALARLLVADAPVWFLDEPLVSLDRDGAGLVEALIRAHLGGGGIAVLATHQPLDLAGLDVLELDLPQAGRAC